MNLSSFSASELVKKSAAQLKWHRDARAKSEKNGTFVVSPPPTAQMLQGEAWAKEHTKSKYVEMGGAFRRDDVTIWFSIDEVRSQVRCLKLIEHKMTSETPEPWFLESALIQTAFYGAMASHLEELNTAKFHTGEKHCLYIADKPLRSELHFGNRKFFVSYDATPILRFYLTKARTTWDYDRARAFDKTYKHQEWDRWFYNYITFKEIFK